MSCCRTWSEGLRTGLMAQLRPWQADPWLIQAYMFYTVDWAVQQRSPTPMPTESAHGVRWLLCPPDSRF